MAKKQPVRRSLEETLKENTAEGEQAESQGKEKTPEVNGGVLGTILAVAVGVVAVLYFYVATGGTLQWGAVQKPEISPELSVDWETVIPSHDLAETLTSKVVIPSSIDITSANDPSSQSTAAKSSTPIDTVQGMPIHEPTTTQEGAQASEDMATSTDTTPSGPPPIPRVLVYGGDTLVGKEFLRLLSAVGDYEIHHIPTTIDGDKSTVASSIDKLFAPRCHALVVLEPPKDTVLAEALAQTSGTVPRLVLVERQPSEKAAVDPTFEDLVRTIADMHSSRGRGRKTPPSGHLRAYIHPAFYMETLVNLQDLPKELTVDWPMPSNEPAPLVAVADVAQAVVDFIGGQVKSVPSEPVSLTGDVVSQARFKDTLSQALGVSMGFSTAQATDGAPAMLSDYDPKRTAEVFPHMHTFEQWVEKKRGP